MLILTAVDSAVKAARFHDDVVRAATFAAPLAIDAGITAAIKASTLHLDIASLFPFATDEDWIESWDDKAVADQNVNTLAPLFGIERGQGWFQLTLVQR